LVIAGFETVHAIENQKIADVRTNKPVADIVVNNCGELVMKRKKEESSDEQSAGEDGGNHDDSDDDILNKPLESLIKAEDVPDVPLNRFLRRRSQVWRYGVCDHCAYSDVGHLCRRPMKFVRNAHNVRKK
jgi:hypothetical protein